MSNINTRAPFFPNSKSAQKEIEQARQAQIMRRNSMERAKEIENMTSQDAKVAIPEQIKDFSRIKKAADQATPVDNTEKIANLKAQIQAGTYQPDYDAIADRILRQEFMNDI